MVVEIAMYATGVWIYMAVTRPKNGVGRYVTWAFVMVLPLLFVADRFSPPPENMKEVATTGAIATLIIVVWTWWFDHNRVTLREDEKKI